MWREEGWCDTSSITMYMYVFISLSHSPPHPITPRFGVEVSYLRAELKEAKEAVSK